MFTRFFALFVLSIAALVSANAEIANKEVPNCPWLYQPQCCNKVEPASAKTVGALLGLLGTIVDILDIPVGITCCDLADDPSCLKGEVVCCLDNRYDGVISVGCHDPPK